MILDLVVRMAGYASLVGITLLGLASATYLLFKHLGSKWLDAKFSERLADYQHRQNQEIERLRGDISRLLDRTTRLHSQEFEVLPKAWELLGHANGAVGACVSVLKSYPDVTWLNEVELERILEEQSKMSEFEKEEIRELEGRHRQNRFSEIFDRQQFIKSSEYLRSFHNFVVTKGIFLEPELSSKFDEISNALWDVLDKYQIKNFDKTQDPSWSEIREDWKKVEALRGDLKLAVVSRLWDDAGKAI